MTVTCNETTQYKDSDSEDLEDDITPDEIVREAKNFENKPKSNLDETETVNLVDSETVKETRISIHLSPSEKEEYIQFLKEYKDIFTWSYNDMTGLSTSIVAHKLPTHPMCPPNAGVTYMRAMTIVFHDMIHKEIEVYVDDVIIKSRKSADHIADLRKFFDRLRRYNLKLNLAKCAFGVPVEKLLGFIVSRRGIELDPSKKPMPTGKLAKWQILLSEFDIVYVTQKVVKGQALAENPIDGEYKPLKTYFPDDKGFISSQLIVLMLKKKVMEIHKQPTYCAHVEEESDGNPWFHDIKEYIAKGEYPEHANHTQKRILRRLANHFFQSGGILYGRTPDLGLLRCVDAKEASRLLKEIHAGTCGLHMNGFVLAKKILKVGYFKMTMETDYIKYVQKCHQCQIHADMI
ncbi:uncharacterized protein [Nicotiana sylvestris]|uniref:uncharacterized protein n=1 Tax=Nicotiana sylvestris TaxID=4096 RepID=UPI00388C83A7